MLCQNCQKNDATTHLKRIINGETSEIHLCADCARALGCTDSIPGFDGALGNLLNGFFSDAKLSSIGNKVLRCDTCGFTFDDIVRTGKPGCPDCYRVFYDKLKPSLIKTHGRTSYAGKIPAAANAETLYAHTVEQLKQKLNEAIDDQNFERAAQLRDEIRRVMHG